MPGACLVQSLSVEWLSATKTMPVPATINCSFWATYLALATNAAPKLAACGLLTGFLLVKRAERSDMQAVVAIVRAAGEQQRGAIQRWMQQWQLAIGQNGQRPGPCAL